MAFGQVLDGLRVGTKFTRNGAKIEDIKKYEVTVDIAQVAIAVAAGPSVTIVDTAVTVTGVALGDVILDVTTTTDIGAEHDLTARVSAANTVRLKALNYDTDAVWDHPSETFTFWVLHA